MHLSTVEPTRRCLLKGAMAVAYAPLGGLFTGPTKPLGKGGASAISLQTDSAGEWISHQIRVSDLTVEYFELGNPAGVPLVMLHGFPDSPLGWRAVVARLDPDRFRLVLPFLRGYGKTVVDAKSALTGQQAALSLDAIALLDALKIEKCHLIGHDWGAKAAYGAAVLAPERLLSLTTLATAYEIWRGAPYPPEQVHASWYQFYFQTTQAETMLREHAAAFCEQLWKTWSPTWHFTQQDFLEASSAWANPQFGPIVLSYYRLRWGGNASFSPVYAQWQAKLDAKPRPTINIPTTFVEGAADGADLEHGPDGQERYFSAGYERTILTDVGHFPHREQPEQVAQAIMKRVNGV